jgi:hypothetical protein
LLGDGADAANVVGEVTFQCRMLRPLLAISQPPSPYRSAPPSPRAAMRSANAAAASGGGNGHMPAYDVALPPPAAASSSPSSPSLSSRVMLQLEIENCSLDATHGNNNNNNGSDVDAADLVIHAVNAHYGVDTHLDRVRAADAAAGVKFVLEFDTPAGETCFYMCFLFRFLVCFLVCFCVRFHLQLHARSHKFYRTIAHPQVTAAPCVAPKRCNSTCTRRRPRPPMVAHPRRSACLCVRCRRSSTPVL